MNRHSRLLAALIAVTLSAPAAAAPAVWEVRDDDSLIWLFGSIGNLPADVDWRTPLFDEVLAQAHKVVFDSDVRETATTATTAVYLERGIYTDGTLLTDFLDDDTEVKFREAVGATGAPLELFLCMRPWFAINAIYVGTQVAYGVSDESLASRLQPELPEDRMVFLETLEQSFNLIESSSVEEQVAMLKTVLQQLEIIPKVGDKILVNWLAGTPESSEVGFVMGASGFSGDFVSRVTAHRNSAWTPQIGTMLQHNEENLVIVDTMNIIGEGGLLERLADAGYAIERVQ